MQKQKQTHPLPSDPRLRAVGAMRRAARALGLPLAYRGDLRHDREALAARPAGPFAWCLYENGTHLVFPGTGAGDVVRAVGRAFAPGQRWFSWDGATLAPTSQEAAAAWVGRSS